MKKNHFKSTQELRNHPEVREQIKTCFLDIDSFTEEEFEAALEFISKVSYKKGNVSVITLENQVKMYKRFPILESMSRQALYEELSNYQKMLSTYITTSSEERYLNLLKFRPKLLNRIPQYQLASYLGVTLESLSRI